jgi:hypothetical protein
MPVYKQMKIRFTIYVHLKVPHDTPPFAWFWVPGFIAFQIEGCLALEGSFFIKRVLATWTLFLAYFGA